MFDDLSSLKDKFDHNRIFTSVTNETRLESLSLIKKHKEKKNLSSIISNSSNISTSSNIHSKYLNEFNKENNLFKDIENILQKVLPLQNEKVLFLSYFLSLKIFLLFFFFICLILVS